MKVLQNSKICLSKYGREFLQQKDCVHNNGTFDRAALNKRGTDRLHKDRGVGEAKRDYMGCIGRTAIVYSMYLLQCVTAVSLK